MEIEGPAGASRQQASCGLKLKRAFWRADCPACCFPAAAVLLGVPPPVPPLVLPLAPLQDSKYYAQFRLYCCEAYEILRKSSDLILSLFHLMAGASIEAIRNNPENAMLKLQVGVAAHPHTHVNKLCSLTVWACVSVDGGAGRGGGRDQFDNEVCEVLGWTAADQGFLVVAWCAGGCGRRCVRYVAAASAEPAAP